MLRDDATTCDASHDRWAPFQDFGAFALLTADDEIQLARAFESLFGPAVEGDERAEGPTRGPVRQARRSHVWDGGRPQVRRVRWKRPASATGLKGSSTRCPAG